MWTSNVVWGFVIRLVYIYGGMGVELLQEYIIFVGMGVVVVLVKIGIDVGKRMCIEGVKGI